MEDFKTVSDENLKKATSPYHIDASEFDSEKISGAYPQMIIGDMVSRFNESTNQYITEQLVALNIDKDVLEKQMLEINRLNEQVTKLTNRCRALDLLLDWALECDFGLDSFPEEYERYENELKEDMEYKDMVIRIAECVVEEKN